MKDFDKRIFICENGHSYESDKAVESPIQKGMLYAVSQDESITCNGYCKICDARIIREDDYKDGKIVAGAISI